jgi:hypothetical protein
VQTKFLNIIETSFGFEALIWQWVLVIASEKDKKNGQIYNSGCE